MLPQGDTCGSSWFIVDLQMCWEKVDSGYSGSTCWYMPWLTMVYLQLRNASLGPWVQSIFLFRYHHDHRSRLLTEEVSTKRACHQGPDVECGG